MADRPEMAGLGLPRGGTIGRYVLLGVLGKGGMGIVYAAYDPELDRKVALKLLRISDRGPGGNLAEKRTRLLREAKAMARLSHPNVIVVYDVGTFEDQVFIAMELVDGVTVTRWREVRERKWKEVLNVFIGAGNALAAAHAAGLVHRDFKPDNVMVTRDGKVRVMDFGLARQVERPADEAAPEAVAGDGDGVPELEDRLTHEGMVVGTPYYMPPEQYLGITDARADQFSFCVALYECLYGEHPYDNKAGSGVAGNIGSGRVREPPPNARVPPWLRKVVVRGMRPRPEDRFPTMEALLQALGRDPAVLRRRLVIAGGVLAAFVGVAFAVKQAAESRQALCSAGPAKVAAAWELPSPQSASAPRHAAVRRAFLATGKSYAEETLRGVVRALDDYALRWTTLYREACEATRIHGEQSEEVMDLRISCLNDRLGGLRALTDIFSDASGGDIERAVDAAHALTPLDRCNDIKQLRALIPPPDPRVHARVEALRRELTSIKALHDAGRFGEALRRLRPVASEARSLEYRPLEAEVMTRVGLAEVELNNNVQAESAYDDALTAAFASHHDDLIPEIAAELVWVVGFQGHFEEADKWTRFAEAALERTGKSDFILHGWLLNNVATVLHLRGQYSEALEYSRRALDLKQKALGPDSPDVAFTLGNIGLTLNALGRGNDALVACDRALRIMRLSLGSFHPKVAGQLNNRGEILTALGKFREALASYEDAQRIFESDFGADDPNVAYALNGVGATLTRMGQPREAVPLLRRALAIRERRDPDGGRVGETAFALAQALWDCHDDRVGAVQLAKRALESYAHVPLSGHARSQINGWLVEHRLERKNHVAATQRID